MKLKKFENFWHRSNYRGSKHLQALKNLYKVDFSNLKEGDYVIVNFTRRDAVVKINYIHPYDFDYGGFIVDNTQGIGFDKNQIIMKIEEDEIDEYMKDPELFINAKKYNL